MNIRIWSKKIVSVLRHYRFNPHTTLFGITGDLDNLGVYVAKNGRANAEVLVDSYNRVIGSVFYKFVEQHPHMFYESIFLPAGEEVFILGTCTDTKIANELFQHIKNTPIPKLLVEAGLDVQVKMTDVSFGCCNLNSTVDIKLIEDLLEKIDNGDIATANRSYLIIIQQIRSILAIQLDLEKFSDISQDKEIAMLMRNIIYTKTLQYKDSTRNLLLRLGKKISTDQKSRNQCASLLGHGYGLGDKNSQQILVELEKI